MRLACAFLLVAALPAAASDGRLPPDALLRAYDRLLERGWVREVVAESRPPGTEHALAIVAYRTPDKGPAVWILAGIHGEEPAGPNAIAAALDEIAALGAERPVVLLPLLNPHGYARNWRYLNTPVWSDAVDGQSVGDSSHLLPSPEDPARARAPAASSPEAAAITAFVLRTAADYPPRASIDLHEDNLIHEGYVYSQGAAGERDPLAIEAVRVLRENGVPIKLDGNTRFDEPVRGGIIGPVVDGSIDELFGSPAIVDGGRRLPGPASPTVLVFETPAAALPLDRRVAAHAALLARLAERLASPDGSR